MKDDNNLGHLLNFRQHNIQVIDTGVIIFIGNGELIIELEIGRYVVSYKTNGLKTESWSFVKLSN